MDVLEQMKMSCSFRNSNPGPFNPKLVTIPSSDIPTPDWVVVNELEETWRETVMAQLKKFAWRD